MDEGRKIGEATSHLLIVGEGTLGDRERFVTRSGVFGVQYKKPDKHRLCIKILARIALHVLKVG